MSTDEYNRDQAWFSKEPHVLDDVFETHGIEPKNYPDGSGHETETIQLVHARSPTGHRKLSKSNSVRSIGMVGAGRRRDFAAILAASSTLNPFSTRRSATLAASRESASASEACFLI